MDHTHRTARGMHFPRWRVGLPSRHPLHTLGTFIMDTTNGSLNRKLRMALVGGGQGAFIGRVHVTAAILDNRAQLVAGALSSNPEKAKASAPDYDIPAARAYTSIQELVQKEK